MCTLIVYWRVHPAARLILACNRDEFLDRPATEVGLRADADPTRRFVAGLDLKGGGTWFGVGPSVVAALTNHRIGSRSRSGALSRGELVLSALRAADCGEARRALAPLPATEYGSFHLLAADGETMLWITNRDDRIEIAEVEPGVHVLGNYGLDNEHDPVVKTLHAELAGTESLGEADLRARLEAVLARGGPGWPCVDLGPYGTRSSAILFRWTPDGRDALRTTSGSPARAPWEDRSDLLAALAGATSGTMAPASGSVAP